MGHIVQGTDRRPWDASSMEHCVQGRIVQGQIVQGRIVQRRIIYVPNHLLNLVWNIFGKH
jgi:hypothetical protein